MALARSQFVLTANSQAVRRGDLGSKHSARARRVKKQGLLAAKSVITSHGLQWTSHTTTGC
eukprot:1658717-Alexandrium_andersonii.AAC.1